MSREELLQFVVENRDTLDIEVLKQVLDKKVSGSKEVLENWEEIKLKEKEGKEDVGLFLPQAFDEAEDLISRARIRKGL